MPPTIGRPVPAEKTTDVGAHVYDNDTDADCNTCGYIRTIAHEHTFAQEWSYNESSHWHTSTCGHDVTNGLEVHHGGTATCAEQAVCADCGQPYGSLADHAYSAWVTTDPVSHWKVCSCGDRTEVGEHVYDDDQDTICNTCGYVRTVTQASDDSPKPTAPTERPFANVPQAGDSSRIALWLGLATLSLLGVLAIMWGRTRIRPRHKE